jgi:hypothetical protein
LSDVTCEVGGREGSSGPLPGLAWSLKLLAAGEASTLVVPTLDHLSGAFGTGPTPLDWFRERGLSLVAADIRAGGFTDAAPPLPPARIAGGVDPRSWLTAAGAARMQSMPLSEPA